MKPKRKPTQQQEEIEQLSPERRLLDTEGAALYTGMSVAYLCKARVSGSVGNRTPGPPFHKVGKVVTYLRSDLDAWLTSHRVERGAP